MAKKSRSSSRASNGPNYFQGKYLSEFFGTMILVLIGCGAIVLSGFGGAPQALQVGAAFGLAYTAVAYSIGLLSGGHINPAVTIAMWSAGRMRGSDAIPYIVWQLLGGIVGAGLLVLILMGKGQTAVTALGQNSYAAGGIGVAALVEFLATLIFALVFLGASSVRGGPALAGLVIGLTLVALHLAFISVTGLSTNPARSLAPAVWVRGDALTQVWLFLLVPAIAGWLAGWLAKRKVVGG